MLACLLTLNEHVRLCITVYCWYLAVCDVTAAAAGASS